jgi:glycosyltransferase involved in cell wall biosynthesis
VVLDVPFESAPIPVTAVVVGFNESAKLNKCLESLDDFIEIVYVDLGSSDDSIDVAHRHSARVVPHERVDIVEKIHAKLADFTDSKWVLLIDPDEVLDSSLVIHLRMNLEKYQEDERLAAVYAPWIFYFKSKQLRGTPWGGTNSRLLLAHQDRMEFSPTVHSGRRVRSGFTTLSVERRDRTVIHHFWMDSYVGLVRKCIRYLRNEGLNFDRRDSIRINILRLLASPLLEFRYSLFIREGYRDGIVGVTLSILWAWYQTSARLVQLIALIRSRNASKA